MKVTFKPLSLAVAVSAAAAGYAGTINAQTLADNAGLGDLAIVPYYTTQATYSTGVSVINTSANTQVVKVRLRRGSDSMDALDFNVIMSPYDVWTGYIQPTDGGGEGEDVLLRFYTDDNSCTVPALETDGSRNFFTMPDIYRDGAEEGYIEVLAMGRTINESQPIAVAALHNNSGEPKDCDKARENFIRGNTSVDYAVDYAQLPSTLGVPGQGSPRFQGVINSILTMQTKNSAPGYELSSYTDSGNALKVSYFIKSDETGVEFGNDAVHIADFLQGAAITNQRQGISEGDLQGFDHPNLNGGAMTSVLLGLVPDGAAGIGRYQGLRVALGANAIINDWSKNVVSDGESTFSVDTDWVVTTPGQYLMTNLSAYIDSLEAGKTPCNYWDFGTVPPWTNGSIPQNPDLPNYGMNCDFRDIPLTVSATVWDREEREIEADPEDLVVSPAPVIPPSIVTFDREVNVVSWGDKVVLDSDENIIIPVPDGALAGWARVSVSKNEDTTQAICSPVAPTQEPPVIYACLPTPTPVPLVGFVAWQRNFGDNPAANYGRIVEHSFISGFIRRQQP